MRPMCCVRKYETCNMTCNTSRNSLSALPSEKRKSRSLYEIEISTARQAHESDSGCRKDFQSTPRIALMQKMLKFSHYLQTHDASRITAIRETLFPCTLREIGILDNDERDGNISCITFARPICYIRAACTVLNLFTDTSAQFSDDSKYISAT